LLFSLSLWDHLPLLLQVLILGILILVLTSVSQSSTLRPPSAPSPDTYLWYPDSGASFHMTPHSAHLFSLFPSYRHCAVHTSDGSPLSIAG
jgi:hypothetical protein